LVPVALVALAVLLTVPWSYFVLNAAYNRDVTENARALARRVEIQHSVTYGAPNVPMDFVFPLRDAMRKRQMSDALQTEISSDPSVQTLVFYSISYVRPQGGAEGDEPEPVLERLLAILRDPKSSVPKLSGRDLQTLRQNGMMHAGDGRAKSQRFFVPWEKNGRVRVVTYVELSNEALRRDFWKKEAKLLLQVVAWSTTGVLALSAVAIFAWRVWRRAGRLEQRAELSRQGLLAERGLTAAVLAHEIRNPLQALRFQLHSLRRNAQDPARVGATSETIDSELSRIQQLVTDYLEHEKAASVRTQSVDLFEAASTLKTVMDDLLHDRETRLTIVPPGHRVRVVCDPHGLRQVLMNLVLNAQQAMGDGGSITVRVGEDGDGGVGIIEVSDTGPGIPEAMREKLFKPFQTSKAEGHGIGLALVKRFVDNFGGSVEVESEAGRGTTFRLRLPLAGAEAVGVMAEPIPAGNDALAGGRIELATDERR
jgi:signal transduction histidine kinase